MFSVISLYCHKQTNKLFKTEIGAKLTENNIFFANYAFSKKKSFLHEIPFNFIKICTYDVVVYLL